MLLRHGEAVEIIPRLRRGHGAHSSLSPCVLLCDVAVKAGIVRSYRLQATSAEGIRITPAESAATIDAQAAFPALGTQDRRENGVGKNLGKRRQSGHVTTSLPVPNRRTGSASARIRS